MSSSLITVIRWTARIAGLLIVLVVLTLAIGEGLPNPTAMTFPEAIMSVFLLFMLAGILIAWKRELLGGAMLLAGYLGYRAHELLNRLPMQLFSFLDLFLLLGLVNIALWRLAKRERMQS
ncbi:MAG: hypothetical protein Q8922_10675 [Bacteroidota bacterium]|nr:hypothetical protein [Bacteroidota bacterium]MDP4233014.1 hypothetical protein [Bacteroidota bacterium]MDP4241841.1 hypothetical protein [Bacteroidota bacterium]MDP4288390.1 hypothetical protein [Bacteroidota bacterium]